MRNIYWTILIFIFSALNVQAQDPFIDQTSSSGLPTSYGRVLGLFDQDNDGYTDVIWAFGSPMEVQLMHNNGDLTFSDITATSGFQFSPSISGHTFADMDNNGWTDIVQTDVENNLVILLLNQGGVFVSYPIVTPLDIVGQPVLMDYDQDGDVDILYKVLATDGTITIQVVNNDLCTVVPSDALQNWSILIGPFPSDVNPYPQSFDHDNDGDQDLLVVATVAAGVNGDGYQYYPLMLYRNDDGAFSDITSSSGFDLGHVMGCSFWDFDSDGDLDLTFGTYDCCATPNVARTYLNNGNGTFTDISSTLSLKSGNNYFFSAAFADIDNDGDDDLYWRQGAWSNSQLYINSGGVVGTNMASSYGLSLGGGVDDNGSAMGVQPFWFDADNDGDQDVICGTLGNGNVRLMVNPVRQTSLENEHYLSILLQGCASGRSALNALVKVYFGNMVNAHMIGYDRRACTLDRLHFGLGSATMADSVVIHWPSGATTRELQVQADQFLILEEDPDCTNTDCLPTAVDQSEEMDTSSPYPNPTTGYVRLSNIPVNDTPQVYDATGRALPINLHRQGHDAFVDLGTYPAGLYLVRVADRSFTIVRE